MKRKILSLILVFAMTVSLLTVGTGAVEPTYGDTAGHWAESSIERWSGHGIIQGSNGLFDPNGQLTCAQLATILAKLLKLPAAKDAGFTDNTADAWYYDAINRCAAAGILNGNGDGTVTPEAPITRERAMVMLARALGIEPIRKPDLAKYTDAAQVSAYAQGYLAAMIKAGIVGGVGDNRLAPQDNINRASTVTILDRAISTYADKAGATVKADGKGLVLVVAENVKITGAPEGTKIVVADGATGLTVNGKSVSDDQTYIVPKTTTGSGSSSSGGYSHSHSYDTTTHKCSCGEFDPAVVATIGNTNGYLTLEAAVAAAQSGDIVKLVKDTSENIIIPNGKTIVIDLNGKKLTNADSHTIVNNGNLTIQGSGTVDNVTHQKAALVNYGTAVLNGGTYTRSLENPENNKDNSGGNSYYTILNDKGGNMTINAGVEVTNVGHFSSMICNGGDANSSAMSKLTIHGGVFSGGINTVKNDELGELTITDGSFSNASQCVIMNWHKANISGGTFETNEGAETVLFTAKYHDTRAIGKLTLTGGTYICKTDQALLCDRYNNNEKYLGTASIAGGTFSRQPEAKYIAAGYVATANTSGTWTVGAAASATFAAQVGGVMYTTLGAAIRAADENAIVKLVDNITTDEGIAVAKKVTLDMANHTITSAVKQVFTVLDAGDLTITGNGTIKGPTGEAAKNFDSYSMIYVTGTNAKLTVMDGTITAGGVGDCGMYGIYVADGGNVILGDAGTKTGPTITTWFAAVGENNTTSPANITIYGGEYTAQAAPADSDWWAYFCAPVYASASGDINISGGTFNGYYGISSRYVKVAQNLNISGGTFNGSKSALFADNEEGSAKNGERTIFITGGTFSSDPSAYVAEGYFSLPNENSTYTVVTADQITSGVTIQGIAGYEHRAFATVEDAFTTVKTDLEARCGLVEQAMNEAQFNAFFTENGKITWTVYGEQDVTDSRTFSFGRAANRFGESRHITEINIIGGNDTAALNLSAVNGTFALPYNWWNVEDSANTALKCKNIKFNGIKSMPSGIYQCTLHPTTYEFDGCTFNGNLYSYQNFDVVMTIKNSTFNAPDTTTQYAFMSQGKGGTITLNGNTFNGYTRGVNLERGTANFVFTNNTITSTVSEPDRAAIQLTDGKSFTVTGNTVRVNAGNAFWFHSAATNEAVTYEISNNNIQAPYIGYYATSFDVNPKITSSGNIFNSTDTTRCMEKEATEATATNLTAIN